MEKYDDLGDDKQISQRTWEGKNLDGGDWKTFQIFYYSSDISWENKPEKILSETEKGVMIARQYNLWFDSYILRSHKTQNFPPVIVL